MPSTPWMSPAGSGGRRRSVRLTTRSIVLFVAAVVAMIVLRNNFPAAQRVLGWAVASAAMAAFVTPPVTWLGRYIPRVAAVILTFIVLGVGVGALVFGTVDNLDREVSALQRAAPDATERLEAREDEIGDAMRDLRLSDRVEVFLDELDRRIGSGSAALAENAFTVPVYFVNAILTIFLFVYGPSIVRGAISLIGDEDRQARVAVTLDDAVRRARRTIAAMFAQGMVVGSCVALVAAGYDLPAPIVLGLVAGVAAMVPDFGILLGILPTVALAAGLESGRLAVGILAVAFAVQAYEALHLRRRVDRWGVEVGPSVVWIVALVGYTLHGVGMALYGVAYAVLALAIVDRVAEDRRDPAPVAAGAPATH